MNIYKVVNNKRHGAWNTNGISYFTKQMLGGYEFYANGKVHNIYSESFSEWEHPGFIKDIFFKYEDRLHNENDFAVKKLYSNGSEVVDYCLHGIQFTEIYKEYL